MKENGRIIKNDCDKMLFDVFIKRMKKIKELVLKSYKPATQSAPQERYSFSCEYENISIVYETVSKTLIITAQDHIINLLKVELELAAQAAKDSEKMSGADNFDKLNKSEQGKPEQKKIQNNNNKSTQTLSKLNQPNKVSVINTNKQPKTTTQQAVKPQPKAITPQVKPQAIKPQPKPMPQVKPQPKTTTPQAVKPQPKPMSQTVKPQAIKPQTKEDDTVQKPKQPTKAEKKAEAKKNLDELYKNGFSIKKFEPEQFQNVLKKIRRVKTASCRQTLSGDDSKTYLIRDQKINVYMRYLPAKKTLQLQGKRSKLFGEIQILISQNSDYVTAVTSHIDLTGEERRARDMERRLKRLLPNAFEFLSEQSRIDLTIGMMDIGNEDVKLSDYSMLLVPPYRGLERLIFDLQRAKSISVKMIGQAYEKDDGKYALKLGYRRKIKSFVYNEVMSALYTEYFAKRNFYAHSDITGDELSRVITKKSTVQEIFNNLVEILEYNIHKLKEIGFRRETEGIVDGN